MLITGLNDQGLSNLWSDWTYDKRLVYAIFTFLSIIEKCIFPENYVGS